MEYLEKRNTPLRLTANWRSHCFADRSTTVPLISIPALLIKTSRDPKSVAVRVTASFTCCSFDTSPSNTSLLAPKVIREAVARAAWPSMSKTGRYRPFLRYSAIRSFEHDLTGVFLPNRLLLSDNEAD